MKIRLVILLGLSLFWYGTLAHAGNTNEHLTEAAVKDLTTKVDSLTVNINISVPGQEIQGLSGLLLYVSPNTRVESPSIRNGKPVSESCKIEKEEASKFVEILAAKGLFTKAQKYFSDRTQHPKTEKPQGAKSYAGYIAPKDQPGSIRLVVFNDDWYTYYEIGIKTAGDEALLLGACKRAFSGRVAEIFQEFVDKTKGAE